MATSGDFFMATDTSSRFEGGFELPLTVACSGAGGISRKHETDRSIGRSNTGPEADPPVVDVSHRGVTDSSDGNEGVRDEITAEHRHRAGVPARARERGSGNDGAHPDPSAPRAG